MAELSVSTRIWRVFLPFSAGYLLSYLYRTVNTVTGPLFAGELGLDTVALGNLTAAYFATFAAIQIPLGLALDRYGPRRCEATLLVIAAGGAAVFALAPDGGWLTIGRALIGAGVAACLMAAFKANVETWPAGRLPLANGLLLAFGGLGAALGTVPAQVLADWVGWRGVFWVLAAVTLLVGCWQWLAVPERARGPAQPLRAEMAVLRQILTSRSFWAVAPVTAATHGCLLAYQSLWAGPWLVDVAGLTRGDAAVVLFWMSIAIIPGYALGGMATDALIRRGVSIERLFPLACIVFSAVHLPLILGWTGAVTLLWFAYVFLGVQTILGYPLLTQRFPASAAGRVNTALNMVVFGTGFAVQSLAGVGLQAAPDRDAGHAVVLTVLVTLQLATLIAFFVLNRRGQRD
ncbi:MAG: MFS transporter [Alphaproteobacteria bacterium]|nr:MFS transporter [Alphaproteobacteria bacterium]